LAHSVQQVFHRMAALLKYNPKSFECLQNGRPGIVGNYVIIRTVDKYSQVKFSFIGFGE
jgi:hypothetical protein